jgi:hypothetical protein
MDRAVVLEVRFPDRPARLRAKWRSAMDIERRRWMSGSSYTVSVTATDDLRPGAGEAPE